VEQKTFKISICKAVEHEALNSVVAGIKSYLRKYTDIKYDISTCQGNQAIAFQIASKSASNNDNVLITIGTLPTQAAFSFAKKIKLVFSSVTNPDDILKSLAGSNVPGVSNFVPLKQQIELFKKIQPNLNKLGIIYNSGETNSVAIVKKLEKILKEMNIALIKQTIQRSSDIPQAVNAIANKVDAVFISNDNTLLAGLSFVIKICTLKKIPVYVSDTDQVKKGCLAALGPNQFDIGVQTAEIIEKIKNGIDINNIPVEYPQKTELFINTDIANKLGIAIPQEVLASADKIIGKTKK
jgi:putative ABC transport system substrate-binding protein